MLDVHRGDNVDALLEQKQHVLPALAVASARHVGVRELVDDGDLWPAMHNGVDVHLLERDAAVFDFLPRYDFEIADLRLCLRAPVRLDEADDNVHAASPE